MSSCYETPTPKRFDAFGLFLSPRFRYKQDIFRDSVAPIFRREGKLLTTDSASFGLIPRKRIPVGIKLPDTMYAQAETVEDERSFRNAWKSGSFCLIPVQSYFEWDHAASIRWRVGLESGAPFTVAGLWRTWNDLDGSTQASFAMITINADTQRLPGQPLRPFPGKRSLVIIPPDKQEAWLSCRTTSGAQWFLRSFTGEGMRAEAQPLQSRAASAKGVRPSPRTHSLDGEKSISVRSMSSRPRQQPEETPLPQDRNG